VDDHGDVGEVAEATLGELCYSTRLRGSWPLGMPIALPYNPPEWTVPDPGATNEHILSYRE
jgi:hypothetical protein